MKTDLKEEFEIPNHGSLEEWARQGVLLLNTGLTVRAHEANSHKDFGWQKFTDVVIDQISNHKEGIVFLLWGKQAQLKGKRIDRKKHYVLECSHPSGLSAHRGFFGCKHFSKTNEILTKIGKLPIRWMLS
jgi:uracil-DNA glycosylase